MLIWYGLYDTNVLCFLKKPFNDWFSFLLLVLRYQESAIHRLGGFYYVHDPLNFYHRPFIRPWGVLLHHGNAERFARNGTLRERNETLRERNETFRERNALHFWERNALYALASFSIFPDIQISSHGESTFCLSSLRQNEKKVYLI